VAGVVRPRERIAAVIAESARQAVHDELEAHLRRDEPIRFELTIKGTKAAGGWVEPLGMEPQP